MTRNGDGSRRRMPIRKRRVKPGRGRTVAEASREESRRISTESLVEGMARCQSNEGMVRDLKVGDIVYVKEIPNMRGHCVVLRNKRVPLIGYHLDRFQVLAEAET